MKSKIVALISGIIFGLGLAISEMINPARVIGFLDITGNWDPTLLLVMGGALLMTFPLFPIILRRKHSFFGDSFSLPGKKDIDLKLIIGAVLFGLGWGIAGLCPGPAIAGLASLSPSSLLFVCAMLAGFLVRALYRKIVKTTL